MAREREPRRTASVFDFLYVDHKRIGLYLSQFSDFGNLTSIVHSQDVGHSRGLTGGVAGVIGGETTQRHETGIARTYDTQWSQVLNFLDEAEARRMLHRGVPNASIGGLVLVSGALHLVSLRPFERAFGAMSEAPPAAATTTSGNRRQRRAARVGATGLGTEDNIGLRVLGSLEQPVFMVLNSGSDRLWSTLDPNFLVGGSADLNLKHGLSLAGQWHVVGILDCQPGSGDTSAAEVGRLCGGGENVFNEHIFGMWREFRYVFGRPADCYGITPLIIMREVA